MSLPLKPLCSLLSGMLGLFDRHSSCADADYVSEGVRGGSKEQCRVESSSRNSLYDAWSASRVVGEHAELLLTPGGQRPLTRENVALALELSESCLPRILTLLWNLHPLRVMLMVSLDVFRGVLPACRGYSQALIINEVRSHRVFAV